MLSKSFLQGLRVVIPITITACVVYWVGALLEALMGRWIKLLLPDTLAWVYWRGAGVALSLVTIFLLGALFRFFPPIRMAVDWLERIFERIPGLRTIYGSSRDLVQYLTTDSDGKGRHGKFSKVVAVSVSKDVTMVGLITQDDAALLPKGLGRKDHVLVYLPWSYQVGGFTVLVPSSVVEPMELSVEDAMRFTMTAGVSANDPAGRPVRTRRAP